ncbi:MAG: PKD domain-containing protein, partial [Chloroflexota bacterium]|nr:PKD domain-containing protein [Chloroflexota bacterium]
MKRIYLSIFLVLAGLLNLLPAKPAYASHQILWWDDTGDRTVATFGPNATISIGTGTLEWACDTFFYASNIYVVPSGSVSAGSTLTDVSGTPNTVQSAASGGLFIDETIGFTAPSGSIGPGQYAVVYDECQNGKFDAGVDAIFDPAFSVDIPADVSDLPTDAFNGVKADAKVQAEKAKDAAKLFAALMIAYDVYTLTDLGSGYQKLINFYVTYICSVPEMPTIPDSPITPWCPTVSIQDTIRLQMAATKVLLDEGAHWEGIAADPPDPNFRDPALLGPRVSFQPQTGDPVEAAMAAFGERATVNETASRTLLASLEKYQGADAKGDGIAALMHARNIKRDALLLASNLSDTNAEIDTLLAELGASGRDLEGLFDGLKVEQDRVKASGLSADEARLLKNLGLTDTDVAGVEQAMKDFPFTRFRDLGGITPFLAGLKTQNSATAASLQGLASAMDSNIASLVSQGFDVVPLPKAGGPYNGAEGAPIALDGSGSSDPQGKVITYAWDLDGDGQFDDATGVKPTHTYKSALTGQVGLKVTNSDGRFNVGYAPIEVTEANRPPGIKTVSPSNTSTVDIEVGSSRTFTATAADPDGDLVTITWLVNGAEAGNGESFTFTSTADNAGANAVTVKATDGQATGGSTQLSWLVQSLHPDADADGWRANVDCDDAEADVSPGKKEVIGNGKDDDCDAATPDAGTPPAAKFSFAPAVGVVEEPVQLTDGSTDPDSQIVSWEWEFGDGNTSTAQNPKHTYIATGSYTVKLTVTDEHGNADSVTKSLKVTSAPTSAFTVSPAKPVVDTAVQFTDGSSDRDGPIAAWAWDFGDGATSTAQSPSHTYTKAGTYTAKLTVTNGDGATASTSRTITVIAVPKAFFNAEPAFASGIQGRNVALLEAGVTVHSYS